MAECEEKQFNLLDEAWIAVMRLDGRRDEVSLKRLYREAPDILALSGELPGQNTAVLRLLLAILHSVYRDFRNEDEALNTWQELWESGQFPAERIEEYLEGYRERFWLFHPETPFYQIPGLDERDDVFGPFEVPKINGELSESANKLRLFPQRSGKGKMSLSYSEAARWLLYFNGFAETFGKLEAKCKTSKSDPSVGVGWLGKLGLVSAVGENLFQTLMLNFVLLDNNGELWEEGKPLWEKPVNFKERNAIVVPRNQAELLTLQSRRVLLERENGAVVAYRFVSGDIFPQEETFSEQMTVWRFSKQPGDREERYRPRPFRPAVQLWRDFAWLTASAKGSGRMPGVIWWLKHLNEKDILNKSHFLFQTSGIAYGTMQAVIADVFSDSLAFNAGLLSERIGWVSRIIEELETTESLVREAGILAQNVAKAAGDADGYAARDAAKAQAYFRLDLPFRKWLESIDPDESMEEKCQEWWDESRKIVLELGREIAESAPRQAMVGRGVSAPEAYNWFIYNTANRNTLKGRSSKSGKSVKGSS